MKRQPTPSQLELALTASPGVTVVRKPDHSVILKPAPIVLEGTVTKASRVLGMSRATVIRLIEDGEIGAIKMRSRRNSKYKVDMVDVYGLRDRRRQAATARS